MNTINESIAAYNQVVADAVGSFREQVLTFHRDAAAAVAKATESAPWTASPGETLSGVDTLVGGAFDAQVKRLEADKQFALDLLDAWTPKPARSARTAK